MGLAVSWDSPTLLPPMSYEVLVEGGNAIRVETWLAALRALGLACEFPPGFVPVAWRGWLAVRLEILDTSLFARAKDLQSLGPLRVGFSFEVTVPPIDTPPADLRKHLAAREERLVRLESVRTPEAQLERARKRVARARALLAGTAEAEPAKAVFQVPARSAAADYGGAIFAAGGLALATGGRLLDTWAEAGWSAVSITAAAPHMVESIGLDNTAFDPGRHDRFDRWPAV